MEIILIIIGAVFVSNIVLAQFLGICPFLGVSGKTSTAVGMSGAVLFVMTLATIVTYLIQHFILVPFELEYLQTIFFILVIASLVQMVEIMLKKVSPSLYQALGVFLPLITTNCAVLGVALLVAQEKIPGAEEINLFTSVIFAVGHAIGFGLAMVLFSGLREHLDLMDLPKGMRGVPAALVVGGILALTFMGFTSLV
jgi:electron transport complex protein RnfA